MFNAYVFQAKDYFNRHFFSDKDLQPLNTSLTELFNNVVDHSESKVGGYVFTQYFPNKHQIVISVCDFGNGIPKTINLYLEKMGRNVGSHLDALQLAFKKGFSTESTPTNRGLGLDNIASIVKSMKSDLLIISNDVCLNQKPDGSVKKELMPEGFPGTLVVISFNTKHLKPLEIEDIVHAEYTL